MTLSALLLFAAALVVNSGSPGPSVAALVARVIAHGWRNVLPFAAAMWIGEALWLSAAVLGLAAIAETFQPAFLAIKLAGVAYLLFLAVKMWRAPVSIEEADEGFRPDSPVKLFLAGMAVTLGNPKIMVFYVALLPTIIDLARVGTVGLIELTATMLMVLAFTDIAWIVAAARARRLLRSPRAMRLANRVGATAMGGAAVAIATR